MNTETNLRELIEHRSNNLPIAIYETSSFYYHWHEEYEFIYTKEQPALCIINGKQIVLEPGMGLVIQPGDLHMLDMPPSSYILAIVVHLSFWSNREDAELFDGRLLFQSLLMPWNPQEKKILDTFERIVECYRNKGYGYEFRLRILVGSVFADMLGQRMYKPREHSNKLHESVFPAILAYIHQNYMQELSLENLVREFHYSKSYIIRIFRQNANMTPVEYIKRYRLEKAKERLFSSTKSVLEVAIECGFQNVSYFTRSFKKHTGITPGAFRAQRISKQEASRSQRSTGHKKEEWH